MCGVWRSRWEEGWAAAVRAVWAWVAVVGSSAADAWI